MNIRTIILCWELAFTLLDKLEAGWQEALDRWELAFTLLDKLVLRRTPNTTKLGISIHPS